MLANHEPGDLPVSVSVPTFLKMWVLGSNSGRHVCVVSTVLTELSSSLSSKVLVVMSLLISIYHLSTLV